jgi:hypothetical protein
MEVRRKSLPFNVIRLPLLLAMALVGALVVMFLWNFIIPEVIPGAKPLNYRQAIGLLVLARILFGGFPGRFPGPFGRGGFRGGPGGHWGPGGPGGPEGSGRFEGRSGPSYPRDPAWREKVRNMTDEEREKFRSEWRKGRHGHH